MPESSFLHIDEFRYDLPEDRIAKYPLSERNQSKLLFYRPGIINHRKFDDLPELLNEESFLVFNNTRVIQARLEFMKPTGARIEIFCLEPVDPVEYEQSFRSVQSCRWRCLVGNAKKWKDGSVYLSAPVNESRIRLAARKVEQYGNSYVVDFSWDNQDYSFGQIIENAGTTPIPPYLNRMAEDADKDRYQTIYGRPLGSVAAPTAGLHFTEGMIQRLKVRGVKMAELTLHVGAGTFIPVKEKNGRDHHMHAEHVIIPRSFLEQWSLNAERVIAVGTTTTRSLESLYWFGVRLLQGENLDPGNLRMLQWQNEIVPQDISLADSLNSLLKFCLSNNLTHIQFLTELMIVPGYKFRTIRGLITNFHLPGSTLLLLIAALIGNEWRKVYEEALRNNYRFLSYGDSSILFPDQE